jgi:hypothetical protein
LALHFSAGGQRLQALGETQSYPLKKGALGFIRPADAAKSQLLSVSEGSYHVSAR